MMTDMNWVREYAAMYLNIPKAVTRAHLLSLMRIGTQEISGVLEVNGDATDASASDNEMPALAALRAPQSLAPYNESCYNETFNHFPYHLHT